MDSPAHLVAEWVFALSCIVIAGGFLLPALRGRDPWLGRVLLLLSAFFLLCGLSQLAPRWTSWSGSDLLERGVLPLAAVCALIVAVVLVLEIRKVLALPTTRTLAADNLELRSEMLEREHAEAELRRARRELEGRVQERTAALEASNRALTREVAERKRAEEPSAASEVLADRHADHRRQGGSRW
jgi:hypothetical protein